GEGGSACAAIRGGVSSPPDSCAALSKSCPQALGGVGRDVAVFLHSSERERMTCEMDTMLEFNKGFVERKEYEAYRTDKLPDKKLAVLSCMDTRLTSLLPAALNFKNGDVKIIKNAGAAI